MRGRRPAACRSATPTPQPTKPPCAGSRYATRYTPHVSPFAEDDGADGFFLDVTGCAHLFGGEASLLADLVRRLARFGLPARAAVAATPGTAWAVSHFHACTIVAPGEEEKVLAPLPVAALRLTEDTRKTLRRLGFKRIGALLDKPRAPLAARFEKDLLARLDQALGRALEPLVPLAAPPVYHALRHLLEPIATQEAVMAVATQLLQDLVPALERDGMGIRRLRLCLYRVDGEARSVDVGLTLPTREPPHVARLIALALERLDMTAAADFGFETVSLLVTIADDFSAQQKELTGRDAHDSPERCAALLDSLAQKLGPGRIRRLRPIASHIPERAETAGDADTAPVWPAPDRTRPRPLLLLPCPEPAEVTALVPEGPPRRFRWRGTKHEVRHAQGPERIADEWWRRQGRLPTRDYYIAEDEAGRRFWLFRDGLYGRETALPRWYVHGLFA
jgi:protein ImuB